jgi:hypothetical protein
MVQDALIQPPAIGAGKSWKRRIAEALPGRFRFAALACWTYRRRRGRWPNIFWPRSVCDKLQARKVWDRDPRLPRLGDKLLVKDYVLARLGPDWVIPTLWSGKALPPVAERNWPLPFVVKVNSGCHWNIFVRNEGERDWPRIEASCADSLASSYGLKLGEWLYTRIEPQILVEPFIRLDRRLPVDYKFWTFLGRVAFINVITNREAGMRFTLFDRDWQRIAADMSYDVDANEIPPPVSLAAMIRAAEILADDFSFVRVDFYEIDGRPLFGEMTFYPGAGLDAFHPPEFDRHVLGLWQGSR